jgi:hypothetical protein
MNWSAAFIALLAVRFGAAAVIQADASDYRALLPTLKPGDTMSLAAGQYPRLFITALNGTESEWITITGPSSGPPAVIVGAEGHNTVEIVNSAYIAIENLRIDSRGIPGAFGISAKGQEQNVTHHIRVEGNNLVGQNGGQQTDGISTKTPTWGWIIRSNRIIGAGTGLYLGAPDGTQPFVNGLIENNLISNTIGYNMEIKHQNFIPDVLGMPEGPTSTIIRNNVFIKDDQPSPDGDRPNLLVGALPANGAGSMNTYEVYGNYFVHNHREALFQGSGRISLHDNIFVDGPAASPAIVLRTQKQSGSLKVALVYNNTIYTRGGGIYFGTRPEIYDHVVGNLVFALTPISGPIMLQSDNIVDSVDQASTYVRSPSFNLDSMDFYPLAGRCQGGPIDLSDFHTDTDYSVDFNGTPKVQAKGAVVYRGAYAGDGGTTGWQLQADVKPSIPQMTAPALVWLSPARGRAGSTVQIKLTGANFTTETTLAVSGLGIEVSDVKIASATVITATLRIASGAVPGIHGITVSTPSGNSNPVNFRVNARR